MLCIYKLTNAIRQMFYFAFLKLLLVQSKALESAFNYLTILYVLSPSLITGLPYLFCSCSLTRIRVCVQYVLLPN